MFPEKRISIGAKSGKEFNEEHLSLPVLRTTMSIEHLSQKSYTDTTIFLPLTPFLHASNAPSIASNPLPTTSASGAGTNCPLANAFGKKASHTASAQFRSVFRYRPDCIHFEVTPSGRVDSSGGRTEAMKPPPSLWRISPVLCIISAFEIAGMEEVSMGGS
jgi:hypothetical protein